MRVHSPDACGTTWGHQRIQECTESHRLERSNNHKGSEHCNIAKSPIYIYTEKIGEIKLLYN